MFTVHELVQITKGTLLQGGLQRNISGVSTDSRTLKKGNLFIAIPGPHFDGHDFVQLAARKGAAVVIVSRKDIKVSRRVPVIIVEHTVIALGLIARTYRNRFNIPVIAVTGSAGKTTTKNMITAVLKTKHRVLASEGTFNNHIGVPMTLLRMHRSLDVVVLELGTNRPGDIKWLTYISNPWIAVYTNIGPSHLERLKTISGVFKEKYSLARFMVENGAVIFNFDDHNLRRMYQYDKRHKYVSYGLGEGAGIRATRLRQDNNEYVRFSIGRSAWALKTITQENVSNALAAICCGQIFQVPLKDMQAALKKCKFSDSRQSLSRVNRMWVIDDTYNANPLSVASALKTLGSVKTAGRRVFICADMLELGTQAQRLHKSIGLNIIEEGVDILITYGTYARITWDTVRRVKPTLQGYHCDSINALTRCARAVCKPNDAVLIKGSRGMRLERVIAALKRQ